MKEVDGTTVRTDEVEALAVDGLRWLVGAARETADGGLVWPSAPSETEPALALYDGTAGIVTVLLEAWRHFGDASWADLALRAGRGLTAAVDSLDDDSLYFGRAGVALMLHTLHEELGDTVCGAAADRAMALVRSGFDGERWGELFELMGGNGGIGLTALAVGDPEFAVLAVEPYLRAAERTEWGVTWPHRPGTEARMHHMSHGALGIAYALARIGYATGRADLVESALAGVADVVARDQDGPDGFLVRHSTPQFRPDLIEPISYGWCHGPAGDAQIFRLLRDLDRDTGRNIGRDAGSDTEGGSDGGSNRNTAWNALADRCWHTVTHSGLPRRLRPGFWDNQGRCCGTASVLALASDRIAEGRPAADFAQVLVANLAARAVRDGDGARWSNVEHRSTPSELEPRTGWAQGSAGIVRELLRFVRLSRGGEAGYAFTWPDQPAVSVQATDPIRRGGSAVTS
ncbi:lanthionine synthetase LanC family protein [Streptomyces sp. 351MFTsu5.1]|uniref:lanthionine synthetase LanC family protein n=1 Tax=Streptomyces sp. 351MFTsu5.1 TaxID=1172180 RepID=UPI00037AB7B2|nr:lanthionine synthetase LanC family protein [Streptomyces sp. 351MFTsu5.1]